MTQAELIEYLDLVGVSLFKETQHGNFVFRHNKSGKKVGINKQPTYAPLSIAKLCKDLRVVCPEQYGEAHVALTQIIQDIGDHAMPTNPSAN